MIIIRHLSSVAALIAVSACSMSGHEAFSTKSEPSVAVTRSSIKIGIILDCSLTMQDKSLALLQRLYAGKNEYYITNQVCDRFESSQSVKDQIAEISLRGGDKVYGRAF